MQKLIAFILISASTLAQAGDPSEREVQAGITKAAIMSILPSADGSVEECSFALMQDLATEQPDPDFRPSDQFIAEACRKLSKDPNWSVARDKNGEIQAVFDYCMWSKVVPDSPICRAELGE